MGSILSRRRRRLLAREVEMEAFCQNLRAAAWRERVWLSR